MSTVRLLKDRVSERDGPQKAGDVVSVPFLIGQELIAAGDAERPAGPVATPKAVAEVDPKAKAEIARLKEQNARLAAANAKLDAEAKAAQEKLAEKKLAEKK